MKWNALRGRLAALFAAALMAAGGANAQQTHWRADYFPNVVLTDQDGVRVRFYDDLIKDRVVAINFVYTDCPDVCPLDTAQLRRVQTMLGDRVGRDIFMYSISINPQRDTPETLRHYMHMYDIGPGWRFLTGSADDVALLQRRLGIAVGDPNDLREHDTSLILGNETTGQWIKRSPFDNPQILVNLLGETLSNYSRGGGVRQSYAVAPQLQARSRGESLYRTRCASCHTIGGGDGLGPDLAGVAASRPRPWLERWLREPDRVLRDRDPIATAMLARFRGLPMPNLGLNDTDVEALIAFMVASDEQRAAEAAMAAHAHHHGASTR